MMHRSKLLMDEGFGIFHDGFHQFEVHQPANVKSMALALDGLQVIIEATGQRFRCDRARGRKWNSLLLTEIGDRKAQITL